MFVYIDQLMELFCLFTVSSWWSCFVCLEQTVDEAVLFLYSKQLMEPLQWAADGAVLFVYSEQLMEMFSFFTANSWWSLQ